MKNRYLLAHDFDGTAFDTFSPSPNGMGVEKAYQSSLDDIFGEGVGKWFLTTHGLHNKTPSQAISDLLNGVDEQKQQLISSAHSFFKKHDGDFGNLIPESKNGALTWNQDSPQITITQMLVLQKLKYLLKEIGQRNNKGETWPQPCKGFLEFITAISQLKKENFPIDTAVISSGHETFIKRTFEVWNIAQPDTIVTEDDLRQRTHPIDPGIRFKPGVFPLALAHYKWLKKQKLGELSFIGEAVISKKRIAYIGDDENKDLGMAKKGNVDGYLFPNTSWEQLTSAITCNKHSLDGRSIREVLFPFKNGVEATYARRKERL
jgi:hypothetical protein